MTVLLTSDNKVQTIIPETSRPRYRRNWLGPSQAPILTSRQAGGGGEVDRIGHNTHITEEQRREHRRLTRRLQRQRTPTNVPQRGSNTGTCRQATTRLFLLA